MPPVLRSGAASGQRARGSGRLVNVNPVESRRGVPQGGAHGEHQIETVAVDEQKVPVDGTHFSVHLAPQCGCRLVIGMKRYANRPTVTLSWDR